MGLKEKLKEHEYGFDKVKQYREKQEFKEFEETYNQEKKKIKDDIDKTGKHVSCNFNELKRCNSNNYYALANDAARQYVALEESKEFTFSDYLEKPMADKIIEFKQILEKKEVGKEHQVYKDLETLAGETLESSKKAAKERGRLDNYKAVIEKLGEAYK